MFTSQEIQPEKDDKPPSFFYPAHKDQTSLATKIISCPVSIETPTHNRIEAIIILYQQYIAAEIMGQTFIFEIELTISFEAETQLKSIKFKDRERDLEMRLVFKNHKDFSMFYNQIKRSFFQDNFEQNYETLGMIGSGKTGQVYKVRNMFSGMVYAAKVCSNISSSLQRQIKILKILQHPNLIFFHQMFLSKGQVYLILDYQDGGNLLDKIQQTEFLTIKDKIKFLVDMLNAFEFLRIKGIIHRDMKPENILYSKKDNCYKIADFSLAIFENDQTNKIVGTPGYLAPQSFNSESQNPYSHHSDIYSLGLIYFELATKRTYIHGDNVQVILQKNKKPKSLKKTKFSKQHISELQYDILRMMIRTQPEDRLLSVQILQSSEWRKLIKEHSLDKRASVSSSTSSNNKENERKNSATSDIEPLNCDIEQQINEENFLESMKKILKIKSVV